MFFRDFVNKKRFSYWGLLAGALFSLFALLPQIDLWISRGTEWNGTYAISACDEPAYAAYMQSIIDGTPRRNSPYSGRLDTPDTPQKESLFSIQVFSTYPIALFARTFGFSSSTAMILLSIVCGFASAFAVFWLFYLISENNPLSFVGTIAVLLCGWLSAGPGNPFSLFLTGIETFEHTPLPFLRRTNPAISFPIVFIFFVCVWNFLQAKTNSRKLLFSVSAWLCFSATVYSYFYHWTTVLAWFVGLMFLLGMLQYDCLRKNIKYFLGLGVALVFALVPYVILVSSRASQMDSTQLLVLTHESDLWRTPELISYLSIILLALSYRNKWLDLEKSKYIFLLSLSLIAPVVFNQQILTGRSLQPYHYQLYSVNYISFFVLVIVVLMLITHHLAPRTVNNSFLFVGLLAMMVFTGDIILGTSHYHAERIWLDELKPVAERIRAITDANKGSSLSDPPVVMSLDLSHPRFPDSNYLPSLSSQPILWSVYISTFPDVSPDEDRARLNTFIYYHGVDSNQLRRMLETNYSLSIGFFGAGRVFPQLTTGASPITETDVENIVRNYETFCQQFSCDDAKSHELSFVLIHNDGNNDLSTIDRWYERDSGERIGPYTLYQVKLRH